MSKGGKNSKLEDSLKVLQADGATNKEPDPSLAKSKSTSRLSAQIKTRVQTASCRPNPGPYENQSSYEGRDPNAALVSLDLSM